VLLVRLRFDGGPVVLTLPRPLGGFAEDNELIALLLMPGRGILLGFARRGVSGHLASLS
jgi:hypothetical protein